MRIGPMAITAFCKCHRFLEIAADVTRSASNAGMLPIQRKWRLRMVELKFTGQLLPAARRMARFAALLKLTPVRIGMTRRALGESNIAKTSGAARRVRLMAFFAGDVRMEPGQRESRLGVIEGLGRFPVLHVVASRALRTKLTFVRIAMARRATR